MNAVRIILADDHALVRAGFRGLLAGIEGVEVVGEADNGQAALELIRRHDPDLALVDISMPGLNGVELTARVVAERPSTRVVVLSMHAGEDYVLRAVRAGAAGYLLKNASLAELELAISAVARGETYYSPPATKHIVENVRGGDAGTGRFDRLTPRQREILQLIGEGHSTKEIAGILKISVKTAEAHRTQLMDRLDIHDLASVVRYAIRMGLVDPSS